MNFADPRSDIAFKKIFGSQQRSHILISFLNATLGFCGDRAIATLQILNPYQAPDIKGLKESILDVKAKDVSGREFIVEMQLERDAAFCKRAVYYSAKSYSQQLGKGQFYDGLQPVYFLGILNFSVFEGDNPLSRHLILNDETRLQEIKELEFNFIELPKFLKREDQLGSVVDKWIYFLKHAVELETVPQSLGSEPAIREALEIADQHNWSNAEVDAYEHWGMRERASLLNLELSVREATAAAAARFQSELKAETEKRQIAEAERQKAEAEREKAEAERQKAEAKLQQALTHLISTGMNEAEAKGLLGI